MTNGRFLNLFYVDTARKHDLAVLKEKKDDFAEKPYEKLLLPIKDMLARISRNGEKRCCIHCSEKNRIKSMRKQNIMRRSKHCSQLQKIGEVYKAVSRRGLTVKITLGLLAFNTYQLLG